MVGVRGARVRGRVLARLLQIRTVAGAVERHLALLAAALRTDFPMHDWAKPLLFAFFTKRAAQGQILGSDYFTARLSQRDAPRNKSRCAGRTAGCEQSGLWVGSKSVARSQLSHPFWRKEARQPQRS